MKRAAVLVSLAVLIVTSLFNVGARMFLYPLDYRCRHPPEEAETRNTRRSVWRSLNPL